MPDHADRDTDTDRAQIRAIIDCLAECAEHAERASRLAVAHRLFGHSPHLREASREADAAKLACERAMQLLGGRRDESEGAPP